MKLNLIVSAFILACATHVSAAEPVKTPKVKSAQCNIDMLYFPCKVGQLNVDGYAVFNISFADGQAGWKVTRPYAGDNAIVVQKETNKKSRAKSYWIDWGGDRVTWMERDGGLDTECFHIEGSPKDFCWQVEEEE
ncbi:MULTISPECIES: hypothetical protein [Acinetobacter]|uniref:C-type lysozyme inhibitor domain-containing protein n=1 Tax=Acinetobacter indicus TaxID=756892 RepID=A0A6C0Y7C7_9GAMM|nr:MULTISPECIES: hypothetical protein [Acinetobacter]QIC72078.1 hypothetical protein FSC09_17115 [Acinetobacter indicus]QKQ71521.1 hypothetical protein E5Y90_14915 [Acinetobacter sp. 10FS3-1]